MNENTAYFESLFQAHSNAIFRHLMYRLGDRERAKELTQEVFMRTWQHIAAGKTIQYEKAFLYRIAHNLFVNEIRTDKTTTSLEDITESGSFEPMSVSDISPLAQAELSELLHYLEQLSDSYREVIVMRYIDDMAVKDIAVLLSEKETTITMRITRAIAKLTEIYHQP